MDVVQIAPAPTTRVAFLLNMRQVMVRQVMIDDLPQPLLVLA
jgi:hypothetical protein